jgi:pyruvate,orthophosphate dikinase
MLAPNARTGIVRHPDGKRAVPAYANNAGFTLITANAPLTAHTHGSRAKCLQRLIRLDLAVPRTVALSFDFVSRLATGDVSDTNAILNPFGTMPIVSVRPSGQHSDWGGPRAMLNVGMTTRHHAELSSTHGAPAANAIYLRFIEAYGVHVARLDPDIFEDPEISDAAVLRALDLFEAEAEEPFPQDPAKQLAEVLRSMARAWQTTTARLLRQARGAPADAGLGLVVQQMALGFGPGESGSGVASFIDPLTGLPVVQGRYLRQSLFRDALSQPGEAFFIARDARGPSLQSCCPLAYEQLLATAQTCRGELREEMEIEFTIENGTLRILDALRAPRNTRAGLAAAVALANDGIITREEALLRVAPQSLTELLHPRIDSGATRDVIATGIAGSPGAATGRLVFTSAAAQASAAKEEPSILVRRETSAEDVRGMQAAQGILTERGGMTSHAAMIARGLGLPCVVGASGLRLSTRHKTLVTPLGRVFHEGDIVTLDGTTGHLLAGRMPMVGAELDDSFQTLLHWADDVRDIGVRANADTAPEARTARSFAAEGIGLCRTEHMFFDDPRMTVMREMIFADTEQDRRSSLDRLLPMQRADFVELFEVMATLPVTIRLFDPPLHEFLPSDRAGMREMAEGLDLPLSDVVRRIEAMTEFNPMLGLRGVRLGVTVPEIYDMQARAIFEATIMASTKDTPPVVPEIMIPLVSAVREVELVKARVDAVAAAVRRETGVAFDYRLGVMVETPRAALRATEIAKHCDFLSFGTNDLTQMTYGLSRDDAGRFMATYVAQGVFPEDPFRTLDIEGVGELLLLGSDRARQARPDITLSICGEHAGDPDTIAFCRNAGFDYVSCSPFRVPVARLAAAQIVLHERLAPKIPEKI